MKADNKLLSVEEALRYFVMICIGLHSIHKQGYVHRDISSKNLFLKSYGEKRDLLVIGDFGLARSEMAKITGLTIKDCFTDNYAAPEQKNANPDFPTPKFDSWAAAIILFEMLTGHFPSENEVI